MELNRAFNGKLERAEEQIRQYEGRLRLLSPQNQLNEKRQVVADLEDKLRIRMEQQLVQKKHALELLAERLEALSPVKKLSQGYAFVADKEGRGVSDASRLQVGDGLDIHMLNGKVSVEVTGIEQEVV